jgi:starvation-inducible DNA-binding protein
METTTIRSYRSPNALPEEARQRIAATLNDRLADGLDLWSQVKVAHWNIKGPHFAALHPLFDTFAADIAVRNDEIAERAVTLGALAYGTSRHVAKTSHIAEYPQETTRDIEHVGLLAERFETYLGGLRESRAVAEKGGDIDTVDLLTETIQQFEKHTWFLRASLEK